MLAEDLEVQRQHWLEKLYRSMGEFSNGQKEHPEASTFTACLQSMMLTMVFKITVNVGGTRSFELS